MLAYWPHPYSRISVGDITRDSGIVGIRSATNSGDHPQTDGLVERINCTLKQMLAKVVIKKGRDWDKQLGAVLLAYRAAPYSSTGMSPFYFLYGQDTQLHAALDFQVPTSRYPTVETEYGQELVRDLKRVRELARKTIQRSQRKQKRFYDRRCKEVKLKVGDLVMLKTEPRFCLDWSYKGSFVIRSFSTTNADIQLKDDPTAEILIVSFSVKDSGNISRSWIIVTRIYHHYRQLLSRRNREVLVSRILIETT